MITVRIAHAEPRPGKPESGRQALDPRMLAVPSRGVFLDGFLVVLADDAGHRVLPAWLADEPGGISLPDPA